MKKLIDSKSRVLVVFSFLLAIMTITNNCTKSSTDYMTGGTSGTGSTGGGSNPGANEVWIQNMAFNPSVIRVAAGTTITWTNKDGITHTVTGDNGQFNSGNISDNGTFSFTFFTAGSYPYYCSIHPSMTAFVFVN